MQLISHFVWAGNEYHIFLPVQLSGLIWRLGRNDVFSELSREPDRKGGAIPIRRKGGSVS